RLRRARSSRRMPPSGTCRRQVLDGIDRVAVLSGASERLTAARRRGSCLLAEEIWKEREGRRPLRIRIGTSRTALGGRLLLRRVDRTTIAGGGASGGSRAGVIRRRRRGHRIGTWRLYRERTAARPAEIVGPPAWSRDRLALDQDAQGGCVDRGGIRAPV